MVVFKEYINGMPFKWQTHASQKLRKAIEKAAYAEIQTQEEIEYVQEYIRYWISCPSFDIPNKEQLLKQVKEIKTDNDIYRIYTKLAEQGWGPY